MPTTIVVGGQFGSEGKGKVIHALSRSQIDRYHVVRCGGCNSGHTTQFGGKDIIVKQLPSAVADDNAMLYISAGCVVNKQILLDEIERTQLSAERLVIDPRAVILVDGDRIYESQCMVAQLGSTASGTGSAMARRLMRTEDCKLVERDPWFEQIGTVQRVAPILHEFHGLGEEILVEGVQGFGLSLYHGVQFPFLTSRDCTASGFASEVGLPPNMVDDVIVVIRSYPIRVGGNSGPLENETTWDNVRAFSGAPEREDEYTSVTNRLRRVGLFNLQMVKDAVDYNGATAIAAMGVDRLDHKNRGARRMDDLTDDTRTWLSWVAEETNTPVRFIGTGPGTLDIIEQ